MSAEVYLLSFLFVKRLQLVFGVWYLLFSHWFLVTGLAYPMKRTILKKGYTLKYFNTYLELEMNLKRRLFGLKRLGGVQGQFQHL